MALAAKGVQVRLLNTRGLGTIRAVDVMGQVDENTRLVALASCHFISGHRLEHDAIGKFLRERGILFCLDAIQTLGAFPTTVEHVDFLAADAHKWLLGPCGAGLLYVKRDLQEKLNPPVYGWHNVRNPNFVAQEKIEFRGGAAKFEAGTHNLVGLLGLMAAMELALEIGVDNIAAELARKRAWLVPALQAKGFSVLNPEPKPENVGGITSVFQPGKDLAPTAPKTGRRRYHCVAAHRPQGTKLPPLLAALLQHRRRIAPRVGFAVTWSAALVPLHAKFHDDEKRAKARAPQLHLLDDFDAERFQTLLQNARRQIAQRQPRIARGFFLGLQHRAVFVKRSELAGEFKQVIAKIIRPQFVGDGFQRDAEIEQMFCEREFFRRGQLDVGCWMLDVGCFRFSENALDPRIGILQIRRGVALQREHFVPTENVIALAVRQQVGVFHRAEADDAGDFACAAPPAAPGFFRKRF